LLFAFVYLLIINISFIYGLGPVLCSETNQSILMHIAYVSLDWSFIMHFPQRQRREL